MSGVLFVKFYYLLPFFAFRYEDKNPYEEDQKERKEFMDAYCDIIERLRMKDETVLSLRTKGVILKQMENVTKRLNVRRKQS